MDLFDEQLAEGIRLHQSGRLAEAEAIYQRALERDQSNAAVWHLLGMVALQDRRFDQAVQRIGRAIALDRSQAAFFANLGEAYRHAGQLQNAESAYREALRLEPNFTYPLTMLGAVWAAQGRLEEAAEVLLRVLKLQPDDVSARIQLGRVRRGQDRLAEAETCFRRAIAEQPDDADLRYDLASVVHGQGRGAEAIEGYRQALQLNPRHIFAHNNLGVLLKEMGRAEEAGRHYRAILEIHPHDSVAQLNLGVLAESQGDLDEAIRRYQAALAADPRSVHALSNLGALYHRTGRLEEARQALEQAHELEPNNTRTLLALARVYDSLDRFQEAVVHYQEAIRLDPRMAEAYNDYGKTLNEYGRRDEALANFRRAAELNPRMAGAFANMGVTLQAMGRLSEAIASYRQAIALDPQAVLPHGNLLYALNNDPGVDMAALFAEHRAWGQRHADPLTAQAPPHSNDRTPQRRLRIGYVSAHFMEHAVHFFTEPILAAHDHHQFEVFCYSDVPSDDDATRRFHTYADHWRTTYGLTDEGVAELVRRDRIDILVDLAGHIGGNRLLVFARKPAPVQVTYIGYQNTTGMLAMDYRLTDEFSDPPGQTDGFYSEQLVRLPTTFFCYRPSPDAPELAPLPALASGTITFGSINNFSKVTPEVLETWARILLAVHDSRLVILADVSQPLIDHVSSIFTGHGLQLDRLELAHRRSRADYLKLINRLDIVLAPFPFNGHTTTLDALWQGVPVVSMVGDSYVSRYGSSGLVTLGLEELIATDQSQYIEIAKSLAGDRVRLTTLRASLRNRMAASPLLDFQTFTRNLEVVYRQMWRRWCETPD